MVDLEQLRRDPDRFRAAAEAKGATVDIDALLKFDAQVRKLQKQSDDVRAEKKTKGRDVPKLTGPAKESRLDELKKLDAELARTVHALAEAHDKRELLWREIPNPPAADVRIARNETENEVLREWGIKPRLTKPRDHVAIGASLGILDLDRAAKLSGTRFAILRGAGAELEWALVQLARDHLVKAGFEFVLPPALIKGANMAAMGYLDRGGESETYHFEKDDLYLVGTAEQALGPMYADETFAASELPKRLLGYSPSFRREAGSYGKDTRGLIRNHQFAKLEMFAFTTPDDSDAEHRRFLAWEEELMQALELPYRVVNVVSGSLGHPAARKYDIEAWFPAQKAFRETHSTSTTTDFQTRRLGVRVRTPGGAVFAHAINGTAFSERPIAALLENGQQADGSVRLPKTLKRYLGYDRIQKPR